MPKHPNAIPPKGEPGKVTDGYYQLQTGPVSTNAKAVSVKQVPAGPIRDKRIKVKIP